MSEQNFAAHQHGVDNVWEPDDMESWNLPTLIDRRPEVDPISGDPIE